MNSLFSSKSLPWTSSLLTQAKPLLVLQNGEIHSEVLFLDWKNPQVSTTTQKKQFWEEKFHSSETHTLQGSKENLITKLHLWQIRGVKMTQTYSYCISTLCLKSLKLSHFSAWHRTANSHFCSPLVCQPAGREATISSYLQHHSYFPRASRLPFLIEASLPKTSMAAAIPMCLTPQQNTAYSCNYATILMLPIEILKMLWSTRICLSIHLTAVVLDTNTSQLQNQLVLFHDNKFLMAGNRTNRRSQPSRSNVSKHAILLTWVTSLFTLAQPNHQTFFQSLLSQTLLSHPCSTCNSKLSINDKMPR